MPRRVAPNLPFDFPSCSPPGLQDWCRHFFRDAGLRHYDRQVSIVEPPNTYSGERHGSGEGAGPEEAVWVGEIAQREADTPDGS